MKKGEIYEGTITKYDFPNKGSLELEDRKVTIKSALLGQTVRFMITKKKSGMAEGRLLEVLEKSPLEDALPKCPYFGMCGGCAYQTMSYENQLKLKEQVVIQLIGKYIGYGTDEEKTQRQFEDDKAAEAESKECENDKIEISRLKRNKYDKIEIGGLKGNEYDKTEINDYKNVWEGIVPAPLQYEYRNKMEFTFGDEYKDGPLSLGLHKKGGFYDILKVSECKIIKKEWGRILDYACDFFKEKNVPFYHKLRHEGVLRNLVVRQSFATGEFLINLVTSTQWDKYGIDAERTLSEFAEGIVSLADASDFNGSISGVLYTENDSLGDVVTCDKIKILFGRDYIVEEILGLSFKISPFSFFQTNTKGCETLYSKVREYIMSGNVMRETEPRLIDAEKFAGELKDVCTDNSQLCEIDGANDVIFETDLLNDSTSDARKNRQGKIVFDLYSGTGTIAQMMASAADKVIGIEIVEEAVEAARENAKRNGLTNCEFIAGDVLKAIDLVEDKPDVIILDPPRDGINPKALEKILAFGVDEMVYISCKPTSLARDLEMITQRGYRVVKACCVDEFPGTGHVETVCLLSKKCPV